MADSKLNVLISLKSKVDGFDSADRALGRFAATLGTAATAYAGFVAKQSLALGSEISDLASRAETGAQAFQTISAAARASGVSMQEVSKVLIEMRRNIQEASEGNAAMAGSFATIGLRAADLRNLAPERQLELIARAHALSADKGAANNAVMNILGTKIGPGLRETLQSLARDGFDKLAASTAKLRLTDDQLRTLDDAGDKLERMWYFLKLIGASAVAGVLDRAALQFETGDAIADAQRLYEYNRKRLGEEHAITKANLAELKAMQNDLAGFYNARAEAARKNGDAELEATYRARARSATEAGMSTGGTKAGGLPSSVSGYVPGYSPEEIAARKAAEEAASLQAAAGDPAAFRAGVARLRQQLELESDIAEARRRQAAFVDGKDQERRAQQFTLEQANLARELAGIETDMASIEADRFLTSEEKSRLLQPLLAEENRLLGNRIGLLRTELELNQTLTPAERQQLQDRIDQLSKERAGVVNTQQSTRPLGFREQLGADVVSLRDQFGTASQQISGYITNGIGSAVDGVSDGIYGALTRTRNWGQVSLQFFSQMLAGLVKMGVQITANSVLGIGAQKAAAATAATTGPAIAASNAPAAAATSIASYGSAAVVGAAAAGVAIGLIIAMLAKGGFAEGGLVRGPGTTTSDSIITRLSDREFVLNASASQSIGYDRLRYMNATGRIPGFAGGGMVGSAPTGDSSGRSGNTYLVLGEAMLRKLVLKNGDFRSEVRRLNQRDSAFR